MPRDRHRNLDDRAYFQLVFGMCAQEDAVISPEYTYGWQAKTGVAPLLEGHKDECRLYGGTVRQTCTSINWAPGSGSGPVPDSGRGQRLERNRERLNSNQKKISLCFPSNRDAAVLRSGAGAGDAVSWAVHCRGGPCWSGRYERAVRLVPPPRNLGFWNQ